MSSTSCVVLTYFVGYLIFYHIKVSQVMKQSTPLQRAHRDNQNRYIIRYIWSSREKVPDGYDSKDSRRVWNHHQARVLGTNITISIALVNCEFSGVKT
jgi:heme-degrading monooxygenase HmoA